MAKDPLIEEEDDDLDEAMSDLADVDEDDDLDLSLLSEDEIAALKAGDDEPDTYDPDDEDADPVMDPKAGAVAPPKPEPAPAPAPVVEEAALPPPIPERVDRTAELTALATKEAALQAQFDDGEISDKDFAAQLKAIAKEQGRFEDEQNRHAEAVRAARAAGDAAFNAAVVAVKTAAPELFSAEHLPGYNRFVELVTADPKNAKLTFTQQLEKAQTLYATDAGRPDLAPVTRQNPKPAPKAAEPGIRKQPSEPIRVQPVPTLAKIPAAATNDTDGDKWSALNALLDAGKIEQHERALAKMTPEQREAYGNFEG